MHRDLFILLALALCLSGCVRYHDLNQERFESLPQHHAMFDAVLAWEVREAGGETFISGEFKNVRFAYMNDVEVWISLLDPAGKTAARSTAFLIPHRLEMNQIAPFGVRLPLPAVPGSTLRFLYKYRAQDDAMGDVGAWMQSFDAKVPEYH
jgi:hypothetical protein